MAVNLRRWSRWLVGGLVVLAALAAHDGWRLSEAEALNARIRAGQVTAESTEARRELRFAAAHAAAASGATDSAINRYAALAGDDAIGQAARYNGANLLLRQALALRAAQQAGQALALVELAKEGYREILRREPEDWAARYNLERAQRLVPDPDDTEEEPPPPARGAERAATTMRGYSPGLP